MPSIHQPANSPNYAVRFRYLGRHYNRSLGTPDHRQAEAMRVRITETIRLMDEGRIEPPVGIDPIAFILGDGRVTPRAERLESIGLRDFFSVYLQRLPEGHKEAATLKGEQIHVNHFQKHFGANRTVQSIAKADLQDYVHWRLGQKHHGRLIRPDTIRKELVTFRMLWNWGVQEGLLRGASPTKYVLLPLTDEKPPFMTRVEIERTIKRGGLSEAEIENLWEAVYLERDEITAVLDEVRQAARYQFIYPNGRVYRSHRSSPK